jgi:hypothetical protein
MRCHAFMEQLFGRRRYFDIAQSLRQKRSSPQAPQIGRMLAALAVTTLAGCSIHPIPDDVSPIPTEAIVAAARCELRLGLVEEVLVWFADETPPVTGMDPNTIAEHLPEMKKRFPNVDIVNDWPEYMNIAVAYDWTFDITETDHADSLLDFKVPFVHPGGFDLTAGGDITASREGKRTFKNQDTFGTLLTKDWYQFCNDINRSSESTPNTPVPRYQNPIYPITGSIGLRQAVKSFLKIAVQTGGLDTFTDELTFTTTVDAKLGGSITLSPVPKKFRLASGSANLSGSRMDIHKVKISLAFPKARAAQKPTKNQLVAAVLKDLDAKGGYQLNPTWRAAYALCVVDGRSREDELKDLRLDPPEVTCLESTDAFYPRGNGVTNALLTGSRKDLRDEKKRLEDQKKIDEQSKPAPPATPQPGGGSSPGRT